MKSLIKFFTQNVKTTSKLELSKANALAFINIVGFVLMLLYLVLNFYTGQYKDSVIRKLGVPFILSFAFIIDLIFLRKGNLKFAGNLLPSSLVIVFMVFLFAYASGTHINYYVAAYYMALLFMSLGALFSDRKFITLNFVVIVVFVNLIYFLFHADIVNEFSHFVQTGYMNFLFAVTGIYLVIFFVNKFHSDALDVSEDASNKTSQIGELEVLFSSVRSVSQQLKSQASELKKSQVMITDAVSRQASSVEEVSTSVEEITQTIVQGSLNAKNIAQFSVIALKQLSELEEGFAKYQKETLQINEFTETIRGIAEKTDVLAINASIEASRAGEFSGGFKVIADEVRKLSEVSRDTAGLVLNLVDGISESSTKFGEFIVDLNKKMKLLTNDTETLANGLEEERLTLTHINSAIAELNNDAQNNASVASSVLDTANLLSLNSVELERILANH
ncbi:MAG: methyl-accepting chemotaxis protein [Bacteroidales bacterium]|nr:methyl-accepting chemotaxis protein [Bacteroidales bacterium]